MPDPHDLGRFLVAQEYGQAPSEKDRLIVEPALGPALEAGDRPVQLPRRAGRRDISRG